MALLAEFPLCFWRSCQFVKAEEVPKETVTFCQSDCRDGQGCRKSRLFGEIGRPPRFQMRST